MIGRVCFKLEHSKFWSNLEFSGNISGMAAWWILLGLLSWYPLWSPSLCSSFEDLAPVDEIYGCPIFKCAAVTWLKDRAPGCRIVIHQTKVHFPQGQWIIKEFEKFSGNFWNVASVREIFGNFMLRFWKVSHHFHASNHLDYKLSFKLFVSL